MRRSDDGEVAVVERGDLGHTESLGDGDNGRVDDSKPEIRVVLDQLTNSAPVRIGHVESLNLSPPQRLKEGRLSRRPQPGLDQPRRLDDNRDGDPERRGGQRVEEVRAVLVAGVVNVGRSEDDAGVEDDHRCDLQTSAAVLWAKWSRMISS